MLLSLFTPTHDATWLPAVYDSILRQSHQDWQWVILPNNGAKLPQHILADTRVKVVPVHLGKNEAKIGALKRIGCEHCDGEAFIEMDHDDLLVPGETLAVIAEKIAAGAGFVYSDVAAFHQPSLKPHTYGEDHGWESYPFRCYGRTMQASRNFPITPRALCEVYYSPDHVRVWSRQAYKNVGGHNPQLAVGDDHDLICRTYLAGHKFEATGGCHYLYRMHPTNTVKAKGHDIGEQVHKNRQAYLALLIREWCRRENHQLLNFQSLLQSGWTWERDLYHGIPDGPYGAIVLDNVLQHCPGRLMNEVLNKCYDALLPGGYLEIKIPSTEGMGAYLDHRAISHHNIASFLPYTDSSLIYNPDIRCRFQYIQGVNSCSDAYAKEFRLIQSTVHLSALKGQRQPGLKHI